MQSGVLLQPCRCAVCSCAAPRCVRFLTQVGKCHIVRIAPSATSNNAAHHPQRDDRIAQHDIAQHGSAGRGMAWRGMAGLNLMVVRPSAAARASAS